MTEFILHIGKPRYALIDNGTYGLRIVSGIITGIRFTEFKPVYEISYGKNSWWSSDITDKIEDIGKMFKLASIEEVNKTHELNINYGLSN